MRAISNCVGDNIKVLCFVNNISMQDLAKDLGVSKTLMSFWVNELQPVPDEKIKIIAEFFAVDLKTLTDRSLRDGCAEYLAKKKKRIFGI